MKQNISITIITVLSALFMTSITANAADAQSGKDLSFDRSKGNCIACHLIQGGNLPGNIGPPLIAMKARFTRAKLRAQIYDATVLNPDSMMPPFGKHEVVSDQELDLITDYIHTL